MDEDIIISEDAGLAEHQRLLVRVENCITETARKLTQYRIDRANARSAYDDLLSDAKILAIEKHGLKPQH